MVSGSHPGRRKFPIGEPRWLVQPATLVVAAVFIHFVARAAAIGSPVKVDSFSYAISAYRLWQPCASFTDLIPDKPPGQALLTGWIYRLNLGAPSRLQLLPIESLFMLSGYFVFGCLCRRWFDKHVAAWVTLLLVLAFNEYNVLDDTTDGFNLNENHLLLPIVLAVSVHFPARGGDVRSLLARGLFVGIALTIKQSGGALLIALMTSDCVAALHSRKPWSLLRSWLYTAVGVAAGILPAGLMLARHGWLLPHLERMMPLSHIRLAAPMISDLDASRLTPVLPLAWWIVLGIIWWIPGRFNRQSVEGALVVDRGAAAAPGPDLREIVLFAAVWLLLELLVVWRLSIPALHYYQQIVAPAALLAGCAMRSVNRHIGAASAGDHLRLGRWLHVCCAMMALVSAMPLMAAARLRAPFIDVAQERAEFEHRLATWSPSQAAVHSPKVHQGQ